MPKMEGAVLWILPVCAAPGRYAPQRRRQKKQRGGRPMAGAGAAPAIHPVIGVWICLPLRLQQAHLAVDLGHQAVGQAEARAAPSFSTPST